MKIFGRQLDKLGLIEDIYAGDINLDVTGMGIVFEPMRLDEITKDMREYRQEHRFKDRTGEFQCYGVKEFTCPTTEFIPNVQEIIEQFEK